MGKKKVKKAERLTTNPKNSNSKLADTTAMKNKKSTTVVNPFEIRFVKEKMSVVNRKRTKEVGKPGLARSRAIQIRKETLLREYKAKDKTNVFLDKRIGEQQKGRGDASSQEDKMLARFAAERMSRFGAGAGDKRRDKKNLFNLGEEETLTHFGRSLEEIERFEDPRSDDEDDDDARIGKKLDASFVDEAHFGGFLTRSDVEFAEGKSNTRQEWIERMIAESKKKKAEKFQQQEEAARLTQDLDDKWKGLTSMLKSAGAIYTKRLTNADEGQADVQGGGDAVKGSSSSKVDDYNSLMRELSFQPKRATAQERLKTDEEIIKEEKDRLEKLEADRLRRMNGGEERPDQDEDEEDDEDDDDDDEDEEDDDEEDGFSDLDEDDDDDGPKAEPETAPTGGDSAESKAAAMEKAGKEIPFTFDAPEEYEDLEKHLKGLCPKDKGIVVHRMIKCNHPQFAEANKAKMELLFKFLLQHIHDSCCPQGGGLDDDDCLETVEAICPYLYDLIKFNPAPCAKAVLGVIKEKYEQYCSNPKASPTLDTLVFFRIVSVLFPTSDYRHPVVTPVLQFMSHVLATSKATTRASLTSNLYVATLFTEYILMSKRFSPELFNFLCGIVAVSSSFSKTIRTVKDPQEVLMRHVPPYRPVGPESTLFYDVFMKTSKKGSANDKLAKLDLRECIQQGGPGRPPKDMDSDFASTCLLTSLGLLTTLASLWKDLPSAKDVFRRLQVDLIPALPHEDLLHSEVNEARRCLVKALEEEVVNNSRAISLLNQSLERRKPVALLKLYEPELEEGFDPFQKKRSGPKDKLEMDKMLHKVKRERKAAKKDLRKDSAFLAKQKAKEARLRDQDRIRKTREIMAGLGSQEGDYRKFLASKKKKRKF